MCLPYSIFTIYVGVFAVFLPSALTENPAFTKTPTNLTVIKGSDIFIEWRYKATDRDNQFKISSPVWNYYGEDGKPLELGIEDQLESWKWTISTSSCPKRLLNPIVRIHKYQSGVTGFAGLNITNVTVEDSGRYQCILDLKSVPVAPESSMYLTVEELSPTPTTEIPTTSTKTTPGSNITTNATVTEKPTSKKVIYNKGEKAELVFPLDVGNNKTWVNVTIYRNKDNTTSGEEKIIDLNKSDGVKNKYLSKREKDIDLAVQGTSNMVNVTFTLQNLKTTDAMFYRMSLVNSNFTTFSQYLYLEVSDCSPDCKEGYSGGMTNAQKWGIGGGVTGTCVLIVVAGAAGRHYYKKSNSSNGQNGGNSDMALKNKVDNCKEGNDSHTQPSA